MARAIARGAPGCRTTLLERAAELAALAAASAAGGRLVLVAGEAGVGKTVLLRRFCELDGLPITTPASTLLDLAAARIRNLDTALDRAGLLRLIDFTELHALFARYPGRPGTRSLKAAGIPVPRHGRRPIQARAADEQALQRPRSPATARQLHH